MYYTLAGCQLPIQATFLLPLLVLRGSLVTFHLVTTPSKPRPRVIDIVSIYYYSLNIVPTLIYFSSSSLAKSTFYSILPPLIYISII